VLNTKLKTSDFDYNLPEELIAQSPSDRRDGSRLMVLHRGSKKIEHKTFHDITEYISANDLLVLNNTKVIPARIQGNKYGGGAEIEVLVNKQLSDSTWEALARPAKRLAVGDVIEFARGFYAEVKDKNDDGTVVLYFASVNGFYSALNENGALPLPPYIESQKENEQKFRDRYQTVYASVPGASAAPTAGLHFTPQLLGEIKSEKAYVTLHTGYGTFAPVRSEYIADHKMHKESYEIDEKAMTAIRAIKAGQGRIFAVGTTSARLLESASVSGKGETDIFIYPGYEFRNVDALITNFHLPKSTLMMLVSAFAGTDLIKEAYRSAIEERYRFFSFGDAMLIL
jgi:S-adenosylmethionine:tRNA ribosyltransferase-isomerase